MAGDISAELRAIKEQSGGDIVKYGITQLDQTTLAGGLVDEYIYGACLYVLARGSALSPMSTGPL